MLVIISNDESWAREFNKPEPIDEVEPQDFLIIQNLPIITTPKTASFERAGQGCLFLNA